MSRVRYLFFIFLLPLISLYIVNGLIFTLTILPYRLLYGELIIKEFFLQRFNILFFNTIFWVLIFTITLAIYIALLSKIIQDYQNNHSLTKNIRNNLQQSAQKIVSQLKKVTFLFFILNTLALSLLIILPSLIYKKEGITIPHITLVLMAISIGSASACLFREIFHFFSRNILLNLNIRTTGRQKPVLSTLISLRLTAVSSLFSVIFYSYYFYDIIDHFHTDNLEVVYKALRFSSNSTYSGWEIRNYIIDRILREPIHINMTWSNLLLKDSKPDLTVVKQSHIFLLNIENGIITLILTIFFGLVTLALIIKKTNKHIDTVASEIQQLTEINGNFNARVPITEDNEISYMLGYFNILMDHLQINIQDIVENGESYSHHIERTKRNVSQLNPPIETLLKGSSRIENFVSKQIDSNKLISEELTNLTSKIESVAKRVIKQRELVESISSKVEAFASSVNEVQQITRKTSEESSKLVLAAENGQQTVRDSISAMNSVAEASTQIKEIVIAISRIAAQTSLLSMNAAIEAAHAGDFGSGFAVVAQEVRTLSENATEQSRNIREQIKQLTDYVDTGIDLSSQTNHMLSQISTHIASTSQAINEITISMDQQTHGAHRMVQMINSVVDVAERISRRALDQEHYRQSTQEFINNLTSIGNSIYSNVEMMTSKIKTLQQRAFLINQQVDDEIKALQKLIQSSKAIIKEEERNKNAVLATFDLERKLIGNKEEETSNKKDNEKKKN